MFVASPLRLLEASMNEREKGAREDETICPGCEKGYTFPVFRLDTTRILQKLPSGELT